VPYVTSLDALHQAVAEFAVTGPGLVIEPPALAAARRSLDSAGLLLLGEIHGVRENPLLIRALMQAFGLTRLALEWPEDLVPAIRGRSCPIKRFSPDPVRRKQPFIARNPDIRVRRPKTCHGSYLRAGMGPLSW
jgi:hypothetical protein